MKYMLIFYSFISPLMFFCSICFERLCILSGNRLSHKHFYIKNFIFVFFTSSFCYLLFYFVLAPLYLSFLFPVALATSLFFFEKGLFYLYDVFFGENVLIAENERIFSFGLVVISLYESSSYIEMFIITCLSFLILMLFHVLLCSIRRKIDSYNIENKWRGVPLFLVTLGIICTALYFMDLFY